jgi:hypothetical protein
MATIKICKEFFYNARTGRCVNKHKSKLKCAGCAYWHKKNKKDKIKSTGGKQK